MVIDYSPHTVPFTSVTQSYGSFIFNFLRNPHTIFHSSAPAYIHTNSAQGSLFSISMPILLICCIFANSFLMGVRWYLIVVLICISLLISDVEHLFMCLLAICRSPIQILYVYLNSLPILKLDCLFFFDAELYESFYMFYIQIFLYILYINPLSYMWLQIFSCIQ